MPKARYRAYHVERAKGGVAMTMTAGSAAVSKDSPRSSTTCLVYKDEVWSLLTNELDGPYGGCLDNRCQRQASEAHS
jgi:2,4-dienoyl-CoA reductase-like NADH-dependent reductase (Old Yellow Enzyme family)